MSAVDGGPTRSEVGDEAGAAGDGAADAAAKDAQPAAADSGSDAAQCATACEGGTTCQNGACACPASEPDPCDSVCTNTSSDSANCGGCGHDCLGAGCSEGACQVVTLASGRTNPGPLGVNASGVYWLESDAVLAVPLDGGTVVTLAPSDMVTGPAGIAVDSNYVYYTNSGDGLNVTNYDEALMRVTASGGSAPVEFAKGSGTNQTISAPWGVVVSSGVVYWLDQQWISVFDAPESSGAQAFLYDGSQGLYNPGYNLAVDETNVYFGDNLGGLFQYPIAGGSGLLVLQQPNAGVIVNQIAALDDEVYWTTGTPTTPSSTTSSNSSVLMMPVNGGSVTTIATGLSVTSALAVDSTGVYWDDGTLERTPLTGGSAAPVASGQNAGFIALDSSWVYWTSPSNGTVMKVAK